MLPWVFAVRAQDDTCAHVTSESANSESPLWRSKHELRDRCWPQNMNWGHLHRYEKCWKSKMCFLLEWGAWFKKWQSRKKAHLMKWWVSAVRAQDDNSAQVMDESANSERPMCRSKHELRTLASTWKVLKILENRKCVSCSTGEHDFENDSFDVNP